MRSAESNALHEPTTPLPTTRHQLPSCILSFGSGKANGEATATRLSAAVGEEGLDWPLSPTALFTLAAVSVYRGTWWARVDGYSRLYSRYSKIWHSVSRRYSTCRVSVQCRWARFQNHSQSCSFMPACRVACFGPARKRLSQCHSTDVMDPKKQTRKEQNHPRYRYSPMNRIILKKQKKAYSNKFLSDQL